MRRTGEFKLEFKWKLILRNGALKPHDKLLQNFNYPHMHLVSIRNEWHKKTETTRLSSICKACAIANFYHPGGNFDPTKHLEPYSGNSLLAFSRNRTSKTALKNYKILDMIEIFQLYLSFYIYK